MAEFKARPATVILKKPFEPKKSDRPLTDITAKSLNTEKRAKEREQFDLKVQMEQAELDELRRLVSNFSKLHYRNRFLTQYEGC